MFFIAPVKEVSRHIISVSVVYVNYAYANDIPRKKTADITEFKL